MKRYKIWNKTDNILTPIGEVLTPEQWINRFPIAGVENITVICANGEINGAFFGTLGAMVETYEREGADFSGCNTDDEKLAVIEAFIDKTEMMKSEVLANTVSNEELTATSLASIAASMEYQNMLTLEDAEVE